MSVTPSKFRMSQTGAQRLRGLGLWQYRICTLSRPSVHQVCWVCYSGMHTHRHKVDGTRSNFDCCSCSLHVPIVAWKLFSVRKEEPFPPVERKQLILASVYFFREVQVLSPQDIFARISQNEYYLSVSSDGSSGGSPKVIGTPDSHRHFLSVDVKALNGSPYHHLHFIYGGTEVLGGSNLPSITQSATVRTGNGTQICAPEVYPTWQAVTPSFETCVTLMHC